MITLEKELQRTDTNITNKIKSDNFERNKREKFNIYIATLKNYKFDCNIIIYHFGCTNDIYVNYNSIVLHIREKGITTLKIYQYRICHDTLIEPSFEMLKSSEHAKI